MNERIIELESKNKNLKNLLKLLTLLFTILCVICGYVSFSYHKKTKRLNSFLTKISLFEKTIQTKTIESPLVEPVKPVEIEKESNSIGSTTVPVEFIDFDIERKLFRYTETSVADRLYQNSEYDRAIMAYQKIIATNSTRDVAAAHSIFFQASSFQGLRDNDTAKVIYKKLIRKFPRSEYADKAKNILGKL